MTITTKFDINDLVQHKFQSKHMNGKAACCFEIIEIQVINCYTTAQVFYSVRPIHAILESKFDGKGKIDKTIVDVLPGRTERDEYSKFREDELKFCDQAIVDAIRLNSDKNDAECDATEVK